MADLPKFWFGPAPQLQTAEHWVANHPANRSQGKRAVGGGLHFTNFRAIFTPNVLDAALGGEAWSCPLENISAIGVEPARFALSELFSGGLRSRLRIEQRDGRKDLFVISSPADVAAKVQALLQSRKT